jgi:hypothetical protein
VIISSNVITNVRSNDTAIIIGGKNNMVYGNIISGVDNGGVGLSTNNYGITFASSSTITNNIFNNLLFRVNEQGTETQEFINQSVDQIISKLDQDKIKDALATLLKAEASRQIGKSLHVEDLCPAFKTEFGANVESSKFSTGGDRGRSHKGGYGRSSDRGGRFGGQGRYNDRNGGKSNGGRFGDSKKFGGRSSEQNNGFGGRGNPKRTSEGSGKRSFPIA